MNEFDLLDEFNLIDLLGGYRKFENFVEIDAMKQYELYAWTRPTMSWKVECDDEGFTRADFLEEAYLDLQFDYDQELIKNYGKALLIIFYVVTSCGLCIAIVGAICD